MTNSEHYVLLINDQLIIDPVGHWSHDKFDELEGDEDEEEDQHASNDLPSARKPAAQTIT